MTANAEQHCTTKTYTETHCTTKTYTETRYNGYMNITPINVVETWGMHISQPFINVSYCFSIRVYY